MQALTEAATAPEDVESKCRCVCVCVCVYVCACGRVCKLAEARELELGGSVPAPGRSVGWWAARQEVAHAWLPQVTVTMFGVLRFIV